MIGFRGWLVLSVSLASCNGSAVWAQSIEAGSELLASSAVPVHEQCICECQHPTLGGLKAETTSPADLTYVYEDIEDDVECTAKNRKRCYGYQNKVQQHPDLLTGALKNCDMTTVVDPKRLFDFRIAESNVAQAEDEALGGALEPEIATGEAVLEISNGPEALEVAESLTELYEVYEENLISVSAPVTEKCICYCVNPAIGGLEGTTSTSTNFEYEYPDIDTDKACAAKNNRRCSGWERSAFQEHYGFLTGCEMSAVLKGKARLAAVE